MSSTPLLADPERAAIALATVHRLACDVREAVAPIVVGQRQVIDELLAGLLCGGHCLLEGVPGLAKTLIVKSLAAATDLDFGRLQFTSDILPADILGTDVLVDGAAGRRQLDFLPGPIFHNVLLADEINRAPPKTQAALLEAMQEGQVTVGGNPHLLPDPFYVLATRNPIEQEGTYPLPEGQLDRFLMLVQIGYPSREEEIELVRRTTGSAVGGVSRVIDRDTLAACRLTVRQIPIAEVVLEQAIVLVRASRPGDPLAPGWVGPLIDYGGGPRAAQALVLVAKALAAIDGRPCVGLEDLQRAAVPVLRHRLVRSLVATADGTTTDEIVERLLAERLGDGRAS